MTTLQDIPATAPVALPVATAERWQPLRGGLLNLYRYDHEEFRYEQGHLLLRGNNGTGKSRVLALQLPFLLDADTSAYRLEPDGDPAKRIEWNLLLGRYPDRLGYSWLEFGRREADGTCHYRTIGAGLHAVSGRGLVGKWFFVTDQRVGDDLFLQRPNGTALTRDRLVEAVGERGAVYTTATGYRAAVDRQLFGLGDRRYKALVDLLVALRQPQLSRQLDERRLSAALSEALPPLPSAVVADVAEAMRALEADREALDALLAARAGVDAFLSEYSRYAQIAGRRRAADVRELNADYEATQRKLRAAEAAADEGDAALQAAGQRLA
ncbi:MAG: TIGR02680 family protein, partial [Egibacteraceae bacterium]